MHWLAWRLPRCDELGSGGAGARPPHRLLAALEVQGWWALRFTPNVAVLDEEALLLEVSSTERLWGGLDALRHLLFEHAPGAQEISGDEHGNEHGAGRACWAEAPTALQALAMLRVKALGLAMPHRLPHDLPMASVTALRPHLLALQNLGCQTLGDVRRLPRAGVARRLGAESLLALDRLWGDVVHKLAWISLPESFDLEMELPLLAATTQDLMHSAAHLLAALQSWLRGRHQGVLRLELRWRHDLRRMDGVDLPPWGHMELRTSEPLQDISHLGKLLTEQMARESLAAPVNRLVLKSLETTSLAQTSDSLLPANADERSGEPWNQFVERISARLGEDAMRIVERVADHRPEHMQRWQSASALLQKHTMAAARRRKLLEDDPRAAMWPTWLLPEPQPLTLRQHRPCLSGQPLSLKAGPERFESGWWEPESEPSSATPHNEIMRDYFVAHSDASGWLWIFKDLRSGNWFLHGVYT